LTISSRIGYVLDEIVKNLEFEPRPPGLDTAPDRTPTTPSAPRSPSDLRIRSRSVAGFHANTSRIAAEVGTVVVSVEYRLDVESSWDHYLGCGDPRWRRRLGVRDASACRDPASGVAGHAAT
jgi:hypothetical protein